MSLDKQLEELSFMHPWRSLTLVTLQHQQICYDYKCPSDIAVNYIRYQLTEQKENRHPKHFFMWYAEHHATRNQLVKDMTRKYADRADDLPEPRGFGGRTPNPLKTGYE